MKRMRNSPPTKLHMDLVKWCGGRVQTILRMYTKPLRMIERTVIEVVHIAWVW